MKYNLSADGRHMIELFETTSLVPYLDKTKHWTVGTGHLILEKALPGLSFVQGKWTGQITQELADQLFDKDVAQFEDHINKNLRRVITQKQYDSLVSLEFNKGFAAGAEIIQFVNAGKMIEAACAFLHFDTSAEVRLLGLTKRRILEAAHFMGAMFDPAVV